jgi:hypothetical protein
VGKACGCAQACRQLVKASHLTLESLQEDTLRLELDGERSVLTFHGAQAHQVCPGPRGERDGQGRGERKAYQQGREDGCSQLGDAAAPQPPRIGERQEG